MSKEELLKYLIAEIDLIMHDKDYRFENANGTWYSRESCRDLTNEEVFEELRTELIQFADLEEKLAEYEKEIKKLNACVDFYKSYYISFKEKVIAELEKVKEDVKNVHIEDTQYDCYCFQETTRNECVKIIDNQIKELKEGK